MAHVRRGTHIPISHDVSTNGTELARLSEGTSLLSYRIRDILDENGPQNIPSLFVVVIDPSLKRKESPPIAIKARDANGAECYFIGFNNGIFTHVIQEYNLTVEQAVQVEYSKLESISRRLGFPLLDRLSESFHAGKYVYPTARVIGALEEKFAKKVNLCLLGVEIPQSQLKQIDIPTATLIKDTEGNTTGIRAHVQSVDIFPGEQNSTTGQKSTQPHRNIITNIPPELFHQLGVGYNSELEVTISGRRFRATFLRKPEDGQEGQFALLNGSKRDHIEAWTIGGAATDSIGVNEHTTLADKIEILVTKPN